MGYRVDSETKDKSFYTWLKFELSDEMLALRRMGSLRIYVHSRYWTGWSTDYGYLALGRAGLSESEITYSNFILGQPNTFFQTQGSGTSSSGESNLYINTVTMQSSGFNNDADRYFYLFAIIDPSGKIAAAHGQFKITLSYTQGSGYKLANNALSIDGSQIPLANIGGEIKYRWNSTGAFTTVSGNTESSTLNFSSKTEVLNLEATLDVKGYRFLGWAIFSSILTSRPVINVTGVNVNNQNDLLLTNIKNKTGTALSGLAQWILGTNATSTNTVDLRRSSGTGYTEPLEGSHIYAVYSPLFFEVQYRPGDGGSFSNVTKYALPYAQYTTGGNDIFPGASSALLGWEDTLVPPSYYAPQTAYVLPLNHKQTHLLVDIFALQLNIY